MPVTKRPDRRAQERFCLAFHVEVDGAPGFTSEIGADSMLFETTMALAAGAHVSLRLSPLGRSAPHNVYRRAKVVRVERRGDTYDVAVKLLSPLFPADFAVPPALQAGGSARACS